MWLKKFGGKTTRQEAKPKQTKLKNSSVSPRRSKRAGPKNLRQAESEQKLFERDIEQDNKNIEDSKRAEDLTKTRTEEKKKKKEPNRNRAKRQRRSSRQCRRNNRR